MSDLLEVRELTIVFPGQGSAESVPVARVGLRLARGETLALVGESGSGKSLTGLALLNLVPPPGRVREGSRILLDGIDVLSLRDDEIRAIRGGRIGIVFQDPGTSLNPVLTVGEQIRETVAAHRSMAAAQARERAIALLEEVGVPDPASRYSAYPHQLSGGLRQRALIAIALAGEPDLLIADEPTTALDVTVQAQILELLDRLKAARGMAVLLITHDLGIVAGRADRVIVMYAGQVVEESSTARFFRSPAHPYSRALFRSLPRLDAPIERLQPIPGSVPLPSDWYPGCRFQPRCAEAIPRCAMEDPPVVEVAPGDTSRCWLCVKDGR